MVHVQVLESCRALARRQHGVISLKQARAAGCSGDLIKSRVRRRSWVPIFPGVYLIEEPANPWLSRLMGLVLWAEGIASHRTAARLYELDAFDHCEVLEVTTTRRVRARKGYTVHLAEPISPQHRTVRELIPVTQPAWTLLQLGDVASPDDVEAALDDCARRRWVTPEDLEKLCAQHARRGQSGVSVLRRVLEIRGPRFIATDSLLETRALQVIRRATELPRPVQQFELRRNGRYVATADLAYPDRGVLIELIGNKAHRAKRWQLTRDCRRENAIELLRKYQILKFDWHQVTRDPDYVRATIAQALGIATQLALPLPKPRPAPQRPLVSAAS